MKALLSVLLNLSCLIALQAHAVGGFDHGNGGDLCEDRFKIIRDDIASWIRKGEGIGLVLPVNIPLSTYNSKMLESIAKAQINCVDDTILIGGVEKTCENVVNQDGSMQIKCNSQKFLALDSSYQDDEYVLVHHEYAGLSGFEVNKGAESDYTISNQISDFLNKEPGVTRKLNVNRTSDPIIDLTGYSKVLSCGIASKPWPNFYLLLEKDSAANGGAVLQSNNDGVVNSYLASYDGTWPLKPQSEGILRLYQNSSYSDQDQVIYLFSMDASGNITAKLLGESASFACKVTN